MDKIKLKEFLEMYDDWNGVTIINDNNLNRICKGKTVNIYESRKDLYEKDIVSFGFYDKELCIRVRM